MRSSSLRAGTTTQALRAGSGGESVIGERLSPFDELASSLVVVVRVVGEDADERSFLAVPDREGFALVLEELFVPAVAPGPVLEGLVADRGPETGGHAPRGFAAGDHGPRDAPVLQRIAPVLDAEVAPGGLVVRPGDVPDGEDARRAGPHRGVCDDPSVHLQASLLREPGAGRDAGPEEDGAGGDRVPALYGQLRNQCPGVRCPPGLRPGAGSTP